MYLLLLVLFALSNVPIFKAKQNKRFVPESLTRDPFRKKTQAEIRHEGAAMEMGTEEGYVDTILGCGFPTKRTRIRVEEDGYITVD